MPSEVTLTSIADTLGVAAFSLREMAADHAEEVRLLRQSLTAAHRANASLAEERSMLSHMIDRIDRGEANVLWDEAAGIANGIIEHYGASIMHSPQTWVREALRRSIRKAQEESRG